MAPVALPGIVIVGLAIVELLRPHAGVQLYVYPPVGAVPRLPIIPGHICMSGPALAVAALSISIDWKVLPVQPPSVTVRVTVLLPLLPQLMLYGPGPEPLSIVPPLKFQL